MANEISIPQGSLPAHLRDRVGRQSSLGANLSAGLPKGSGPPRIGTRGARWRLNRDGTEQIVPVLNLDVVIVGANPAITKSWYAKEWSNDSEPTSPDCFSMDGLKPSPQSESPQSALCATCPKNQWGSKVHNGQKLKACTDTKRLAVVLAEDCGDIAYLLQVTPAALTGLNSYQKLLASKGLAPEMVITRLTFDETASFPKIKFDFGGFVTEEALNIIDAKIESAEVAGIVNDDYTAVTTTANVVSAPKPGFKAAVEPPVEVVIERPPAKQREIVVEQDEYVPPVKAKPVAAKPAAAREPEPVKAVKTTDITSDLQKLLATLDDDSPGDSDD